jgi:hypothetical protein
MLKETNKPNHPVSLFMPVCSHCGRVRTAKNKWRRIAKIIIQSPFTELSHGLCPECSKIHYPDLY